ncbi:MAG: MBG-2 domain-containing protein, partial [Firmicutes bacterium]|nr:MBG-2 domain-containing protein [Bacillota bacterium]
VGEYAITPSGAKLQGNYSVTYERGTLTINKSNAMTVSGTPYNKKYDGASHGDAATPSVAQGTTVKYSTNGGTSWSTAVPSIKDFGTVNVQVKTENKNYYDANCSYVLNVMKRDVTITSGDASKTYDGSPLVNGNISVGKDGFVSGEGATYNVTGSQLDAGNSPNTFAYALKANTKNTNYNIEKTEGTLTVKPIATEIVITAKDKEKMYDGTPLTEAGFTYTPNVLVAGDTLTAVVDGTITDFGTEANVVKSYQVKRGDNVVTGNYTFGTSVDGVLSITKRPVTLTSASDSKIYDGLPLTNHNVTAGGEGFASGEGATYDVTGSQTELGNSPNYFSYTLNPGTDENNYNITKVEGTLIVAEIVGEISVITTGGEFTYDGKPHGGEVTVVGLPDGFSVATAKSNTTATHVADGTVDVTCDRLAIKDKAGKIIVIRDEGPTEEEGIYEDETYVSASSAQAVSASPLTIKYYNDTVKIKPATMTVTTDSATKTYDGTALKANGHVRGLVKGETVGFKTTGSRTDVGSSKNTYTLVWGSFFNTQTAHKSDYKVKENLGTLTINAAAGPVPTPAGPLAAVQRMLGIDDGDTPLANMDKNHGCCMLHLLLMLAALIVLIGYTKSMKRRQEEIFELRRKVGERAKKQGVSK